MNILTTSKIGGRLEWLRVYRKDGSLKTEVKDVKNIVWNAMLALSGVSTLGNFCRTYTSEAENYQDVDGTWSQSGNTVTRSTGSGTFPSSPSQAGNELYWYDAGENTGHRCHIVSRTNDTTIVVSGPPMSITGAKLRRYLVNGAAHFGSAVQTSSGSSTSSFTDHVAGTRSESREYSFGSASASYSLGSLSFDSSGRVKLPEPIAIEEGEQIQVKYTITETVTGRSADLELGPDSVGVPQKFPILDISGDGTDVLVTFAEPTIFLAGDKLDLRNVTPKKTTITGITSDAVKFTVTAPDHGYVGAEDITIEGASVPGYNGDWVVGNVTGADTFEVSDASNLGASSGGTVRLKTPPDYFNSLGIVEIDEMVSADVARISSDITGPPVDLNDPIGGDPGITVRWRRSSASPNFRLILTSSTANYHYDEANAKELVDDAESSGGQNHNTAGGTSSSGDARTVAAPENDFVGSNLISWNAGTGTAKDRIKQFTVNSNVGGSWCQITLNTPITKKDSDRLRIRIAKKMIREIQIPE